MKLFESTFFKLPKPRPEIVNMEPYSAPLEGRRGMLRLDFNENTIGPSPKVIEAIHKLTSEEIAVYPEYNGLQKAVVNNINSSEFCKPIIPQQIGLFNGVDAAIHAIFHAYGDTRSQCITTTPTFGYYKPCASMQGMKILEFPYEGLEFQFPFNAIYQSLVELKPKIMMICNPNNPTGTILPAKQILDLAKASPQTLIVIDELYAAFLGDSVLPLVNFETSPNIVVLRSLSKTSGLAGLRIGFAIGKQEIIDYILRVTGPYDINSFAVAAAFAALNDQKYIDNYVKEVLKARVWIKDQLTSHNYRHHIKSGNYFLIWPKSNAAKVVSSLRDEKILVRSMQGKQLLDGSLRVSIGTTDQMKQFWETFLNSDSR
ncbi:MULTISPECIES: pyridoxal phosphate-dependent aminotransferase [Prochlorococcus]|uniref:pyridoxal phosphate-dependent aminotransferase n=1 Tax=Prochlorococcus TaxID=1218 RepID=UPI000533A621|nr:MULTISPECIES: histidinol-phosphate transaminase [Prochlorococcus]KGG13186.1 Histidinol-phosphate aminotransferase [Prochlorococcus sp. MIT 0601]